MVRGMFWLMLLIISAKMAYSLWRYFSFSAEYTAVSSSANKPLRADAKPFDKNDVQLVSQQNWFGKYQPVAAPVKQPEPAPVAETRLNVVLRGIAFGARPGAVIEEGGKQHAEEDDEVGCGQTLVLQGVQGADLNCGRVALLHGAHQLEDGLKEQDDGEDDHAHDHDAGEGGRLHIGVGHLGEVAGLEPCPDADGEENDGADQVGKGHRFHFVFVQKGFLLSLFSKKGQARTACPSKYAERQIRGRQRP